MRDIKTIEHLIADLRLELYSLIEKNYNDFTKDEIVKTSQKLDEALDLYLELTSNKELRKIS